MAMTAFEIFGVLKLDKKDFESGLKSAEKESSLLGSTLGNAAKVGMAAITAAGTAVLGFGASAVAAGSQFDAAMGGVAATMGTTIEGMEADVGEVDTAFGHFSGTLRDFAIYMGQNTVFSATQSAEALNYMALAGYNAQESMNMLPAVLDMAAAGSMDLARASDMITDTQSALELSFERTQYMVNEFAKAASTGNTSVEQLGDAFLRVGGLAKETNGGFVTLADGTQQAVDNVTEMEIAFTAMANAGVKGAEAGTHMRNMLMKLTGPTDDGAKALEAMGVSVFDTEGKMRSLKDIFGELNVAMGQMTQQDKLQAIQDLFNARDLASAEALLGAVEQDWDAIGESILQADGAASQMAETKLDNLQGDMVKFNSALEAVQIAINDDVSPALRDFVQFGTEGLQTFKDAFDTGGLDAAISAIGPILADGLTMIVEKIPDIVQAGANLLGGFIEGIVDAGPQLLSTAGELVTMLFEGLVTGLPQATEKAVEIIGALADGIRENLPQMLETGLNALMEFSESLRENVGLLVDAGLDMILALAEGLIESLPVLIETLPTIIDNIANIINDNAPKLIETGIQILIMLITGIIQAIPTLIANLPIIIKTIFDVLMAVNWMDLGKSILTAITDGIKAISADLPGALKSIGQKAVEWFKAIPWRNLGSSIIDFIKNGMLALVTSIPTALENIGKTAVTLFKAINWLDLGLNVVKGIAKGVADGAHFVLEKISELVKQAWESVKSFFGIKSPSRLMAYAGRMIDAGLAVGVESDVDKVEDAMDSLSNAASMAFNPFDSVEDVQLVTSTKNNGYSSNGYVGETNLTMNIYGAVGQDVRELADIISERINEVTNRKLVSVGAV